jgi:hypothetical protein
MMKLIETIEVDGMKVELAEGPRGYVVRLIDADVDRVVPFGVTIYPFGRFTLDAVKARARELAAAQAL